MVTGLLMMARWLAGTGLARGATTMPVRLPSFVVFARRALIFCNWRGYGLEKNSTNNTSYANTKYIYIYIYILIFSALLTISIYLSSEIA